MLWVLRLYEYLPKSMYNNCWKTLRDSFIRRSMKSHVLVVGYVTLFAL